ncbi:glutamine amidotransferase [Ignicoccus islandicus DSM 13165]|uniref:Glutamine amidotransferase n=1 Tax=Ignicoccus islandicus DSM 13165 TaxID=940295 RepID=A0A0U2WLZ7_9CREN|nr:class II glutamine amidotransferase [Ignicoccus islandicus]ALU11969.1 glutamine amidotransferase [Ignicoccus islandicus DSM 13165]
MCGIAGIMIKDKEADVGQSLYEMLKSLQHRGMDSAGTAIYNNQNHWLIRFVVENEPNEIAKKIRYMINVIDFKSKKLNDGNYMLEARVPADVSLEELKTIIRKYSLSVLSIGRKSVISKDVGLVDDVERVFEFSKLKGTHGIGHVRFSTESAVDALHAHPFQTFDFPDIAIVHNGQITNYWKRREILELEGHVFQTDNDSELIIHYIVNKLRKGYSLEEALHEAVRDLDGPFAFLISMPEGIGMARDRLGLRPLVTSESDEVLVAASEEVAIRKVLPEGKITYLRPGEVEVWKL